VLAHLLLALALVIALGAGVGALFRRIGQPPVLGEVVAGILLGPSFLGWLWPAAYAFVLPSTAAPLIGAVAQLGVVLYMFLVGLELNPARLRRQLGAAVVIANAGIVVPFAMGVGLAVLIHPGAAPPAVPLASFGLFAGVAMSITAFPVLARILSDLRLSHTDLGVLALASAAIGDVTAWCLLAFVVGVAGAGNAGVWTIAVPTIAYIVLLFVAIRPMVRRIVLGAEPTPAAVTAALVALLVSAFVTEAIGVHAIFGAFLFGAVVPHDSRLADALETRFSPLVTLLLLPAFFAFTGMRTEIGLLSTTADWLLCAAIVGVAVAGKFGAVTVAARATGVPWRQAAGLGALMNTRGLMELIVLNVGLELGVITPRLYTMFVLMALVTTFATAPLLRMLMASTGPAGAMGPGGAPGVK
jgi:Kef-type K+ transport system membrane component KefB